VDRPFEGDGSAAGRDLDHWFRAEEELLQAEEEPAPRWLRHPT